MIIIHVITASITIIMLIIIITTQIIRIKTKTVISKRELIKKELLFN